MNLFSNNIAALEKALDYSSLKIKSSPKISQIQMCLIIKVNMLVLKQYWRTLPEFYHFPYNRPTALFFSYPNGDSIVSTQ